MLKEFQLSLLDIEMKITNNISTTTLGDTRVMTASFKLSTSLPSKTLCFIRCTIRLRALSLEQAAKVAVGVPRVSGMRTENV